MASNTVIFIRNSEISPLKYGYYKDNLSFSENIKMHFSVPFYHLPKRILGSMIPPIFGNSKIYVDLLGPFLAILILTALLHYGHASKVPTAASKISPIGVIFVYVTLMPVLGFILGRFGQSAMSFLEILSILGYSIFGHIFTLLFSLILFDEESNIIFFVCMLIFGGLSTLRIVLILIALIPKPGLRLIICSLVSILQLLFLIFLHFVYMHRTYSYGRQMQF